MTALSAPRATPRRLGDRLSLPVAAAVLIYDGALVCLDGNGRATKGQTATGLRGIGVARETVDNAAGAAGARTIEIETGVFRFANSASGDAITDAHIGQRCFVVDDDQVALTNGAGTRSPAGTIVDVDEAGVWVSLGAFDAASGALLAANNLSDVAAAATARANIGAHRGFFTVQAADLRGAQTQVYRWVAPIAGVLVDIRSVLNGALTVGDATITAAINGTPVTGGALTITQAGSAAGDVDAATPSAANTFAAGDVITFTVGGTNTAQVSAGISVEFTH